MFVIFTIVMPAILKSSVPLSQWQRGAYQLANIPTITLIFVKLLKSSEDRGPQDLKTGYAEFSLVDYVKLVQIKGSAAA